MIILLSACSKNQPGDTDTIPTCIQSIIDQEIQRLDPLLTVKSQVIDGESHYWLNTDAVHYDGSEYIVNQNCDTVCYFCGECNPLACSAEYDYEKWVTIWTE